MILHGGWVREVEAVEALVDSRVRDVGKLAVWRECNTYVTPTLVNVRFLLLRYKLGESIPLGSTNPSATIVTAPVWSFQR